jgi:hypothetical protein
LLSKEVGQSMPNLYDVMKENDILSIYEMLSLRKLLKLD